ncbi:hypothetical protein DPMN_058955 [Dreissena polymorpha]|uniref:Telomerase reverse transcriptase n=1 Tax=Dreissena polymorpha TaxID=45954 RepID=A0A9D4C312_DREPO|nr:hypothetical protein DPMN_058955 [Dreissena polymorpha]
MSDLPLLTWVFVCFHGNIPAFTWTSLSQGRSLHDLLMATVEKLLRRNPPGGNLLTTGYYFLSSNPNTVYCGNNLESKYPNSLVNRFHFSQWQQLLDRVGDSVLAYLFETASLYQEIQGACFVQLTGTPLYNAEPPDTEGQHVLKQGKNRKQINNSIAHGGTSNSEHKQQKRDSRLQSKKITRDANLY